MDIVLREQDDTEHDADDGEQAMKRMAMQQRKRQNATGHAKIRNRIATPDRLPAQADKLTGESTTKKRSSVLRSPKSAEARIRNQARYKRLKIVPAAPPSCTVKLVSSRQI
ncbi:MAG TPA: hypothetical protein VF201_01580 [Nitrolancea sp.]